MPAPFDGYVEKPARVSSTCLVSVQRNRYSVPCELAGHMVSTRLYPNRVSVVAGDVVVASHDRLVDRSQTCFDWPHYIPLVARKPGALRNGVPFMDLPKPLHRLRQGLLRYEGGVMAQVLAGPPIAGLDAVGAGLGPRGGLGPLANTDRYDSRRSTNEDDEVITTAVEVDHE